MSPLQTYNRTNAEYAATYGKNERTIQRWKSKGWPLDDEQATRLLLATAAGAQNGSPGGEPVPRPEGKGELGLHAANDRLKTAERAAYAAYQAACGVDDELAANARLKQWTALAEQLRKSEQSSPEVAEANKNSVSLAELNRDLTVLFQKLREDLEAIPARVGRDLVGLDEIAIREALAREVAEVVEALFHCDYLTGEGGSHES